MALLCFVCRPFLEPCRMLAGHLFHHVLYWLQASCWAILYVCWPHTEPCFMLCAGHLLSPSPTPHVFTRWSTSRLNSGGTSTSTSPCGSTRSSFNYRQPYLGWRSQERLTRPRTPAERLAAGLLPTQQQQQQHQHQLASPQGIITPKQTQQELQQLLQQEAELEQLQREDEEQVG